MKLSLGRKVLAIIAALLIIMVAAASAYAYVAETYPDFPGIRVGDRLRMVKAHSSTPPHTADMAWIPGISGYSNEYLVPEKTSDEYWSDDGDYYVRVTGYKGESSKQCLVNLTVKGHVLDRTVIRTYDW